MAPSFVAGKKARCWVNTIRLSRISDSYELKREVEVIETTTHEDADDQTNIAALRKGGFTFGGMFDGSTERLADSIGSALGSSVAQAWTYAPAGDAVGAIGLLWQSVHSEMNAVAPAKGRVDVRGASVPTGRILSGKIHCQGTAARTTTGVQTAVDGSTVAAALGSGARANFHLTAATTLTSVTVKIQHSSVATSAFVDLFTFTSTAVGFQSSTSATVVKRYTRANVSAFTGGAGKTIQVLAALGRNTL